MWDDIRSVTVLGLQAWLTGVSDQSALTFEILRCSPFTQMSDFKLTDLGFYLVGVSEVSIPQQAHLLQIFLLFLRSGGGWRKEWGTFSILCCCRATSNPRPTRLGKKYISPTCWIKGHCPILDRRAVGPWTYAGVRANFHIVCRVGFKAVEHVAGLVVG